ncbi:hypothetical protein GA0115245_116133 [Streptomyces sp. di188]|nr:hypothetical protein GA0115238_124724 [Streptomyces sp. di50b]SCD89573.1 hypothetical protein GA0115245_116133 [Streptomyces sp. di188]
MIRFRHALRLPRSPRPPPAHGGLLLAGTPAAQARDTSPRPAACPEGLPDGAARWTGTDANGAHYAARYPRGGTAGSSSTPTAAPAWATRRTRSAASRISGAGE